MQSKAGNRKPLCMPDDMAKSHTKHGTIVIKVNLKESLWKMEGLKLPTTGIRMFHFVTQLSRKLLKVIFYIR